MFNIEELIQTCACNWRASCYHVTQSCNRDNASIPNYSSYSETHFVLITSFALWKVLCYQNSLINSNRFLSHNMRLPSAQLAKNHMYLFWQCIFPRDKMLEKLAFEPNFISSLFLSDWETRRQLCTPLSEAEPYVCCKWERKAYIKQLKELKRQAQPGSDEKFLPVRPNCHACRLLLTPYLLAAAVSVKNFWQWWCDFLFLYLTY